MNEKLKEIASNYWDDDYFTDFDKTGITRHFLNEYGKHIIRECLDILEPKSRYMGEGPEVLKDKISQIKQHFGVEE